MAGCEHFLRRIITKDPAKLARDRRNPRFYEEAFKLARDVPGITELTFMANALAPKNCKDVTPAQTQFWTSFTSLVDERLLAVDKIRDNDIGLLTLALEGYIGPGIEKHIEITPLSHIEAARILKALPARHRLAPLVEKQALVANMGVKDATMVFPLITKAGLTSIISPEFATALQPLAFAHMLQALARHRMHSPLTDMVPILLTKIAHFDDRSLGMVANSYSRLRLHFEELSHAIFAEACKRVRRHTMESCEVTTLLHVATTWKYGEDFVDMAVKWCLHHPDAERMSIESLCVSLLALTTLRKKGGGVTEDQLSTFLDRQYDNALRQISSAVMHNTIRILAAYAKYEPKKKKREELFLAATPNIVRHKSWKAQDIANLANAFSRARIYSPEVLHVLQCEGSKNPSFSPLERSSFLNALGHLAEDTSDPCVEKCFSDALKEPLGNEESVLSVHLNARAKVYDKGQLGAYDEHMINELLSKAQFSGLPLVQVFAALAKFNHQPLHPFWNFSELSSASLKHCALLLHSLTKLDFRGPVVERTVFQAMRALSKSDKSEANDERLVGMLLDACFMAAAARCLSLWDPYHQHAWKRVVTWSFKQTRDLEAKCQDQLKISVSLAASVLCSLPHEMPLELWRNCAILPYTPSLRPSKFQREVKLVVRELGLDANMEHRIHEHLFVDLVIERNN